VTLSPSSDRPDRPAARLHLAVVGSGDATAAQRRQAEQVGRAVAEAGAVVVCGGLGGVMEAACKGAKAAGGLTVGILPGPLRSAANPYVDVALPTGLGEARNVLVVRAADAVVAVGGEYGTLSEIALALQAGTPVVGLGTWDLARGGRPDRAVRHADSALEAVTMAVDLARSRRA
jgi:hypothetical protein